MPAMSIAGPVDQPSQAAGEPGIPINRRTALGAALAGGAGLAALRVVVYPRLEELLQARAVGSGHGDWVSPLGAEKARVAHLLRRTTFGASLDDFERAASEGYAKTVDRLLETKPAPPPDLAGGDDVSRDRRLNIGALQQWWVD